MTDATPLSGRAQVRALFLDPIERAGAKRRARMTLDNHNAMKERLAESFAHMPASVLEGLRDLVFRYLDGKGGDQWPPEAWIRKHGLRLCPKPPRANPYVQSLMASAMGQAAVAGGYGEELLRLAIQFGPPPSRYDVSRMKRAASAAARDAGRIRRQRDRGKALASDLDWLAQYEAAQALAVDMAGKGQGDG